MLLTDELWEAQMASRGLERAQREFDKRAKGGNIGETPAGRDLIQKVITDLGNKIAEFMVNAEAKRGVKPMLHQKAGHLDPFVISFIGIRGSLNAACRERASLIVAGRNIGKMLEAESRAQWMQQSDPGRFKAIMDELKKRATSDENHIDRVLRANLHEFGEGAPVWTDRETKMTGIALIDMVIQNTGLVRAEVERGARKMKGRYVVLPADGVLDWLDRRTEIRGLLTPRYAPKLAVPVDWDAPKGGGYTSLVGRPLSVLTKTAPEQRQAVETASMGRVYAALNSIQKTEWQVNRRVLDVAQRAWDKDMSIGGLPMRSNRTPRPYPEGASEEVVKAWKREAAKIYTENAVSMSERLSMDRILTMGSDLSEAQRIYYPHRCDFRGRVYAIPEGLSPQGGDVSKGLLTFADGIPMDEAGIRWLNIHGANTFGVDKVPFMDRVGWAEANTERALATAADPFRDLWWTEADSPFQFLAWCFELDRVRNLGGMTSLPVSLDGSCNGLQHFSAMLRDPVGGAAVNLIPSDHPQDVYQRVADRVLERLRQKALNGDWVARGWLDFGVDRKVTKRPVMVLPYGGTIMSCVKYVREAVMEKIRNGQENPFGDEVGKHSGALATEVWHSIGEVVVAAREAMGWLQKVGRALAKADHHPEWTAPSGFPVVQVYTDDVMRRIETTLGGRRIRIAEYERTDRPSPGRNSLAISPNFVHSLDAAALVETVTRCGDMPLAMVHDSYGTRAPQVDLLSRNLRQAFVDMYENHCPLNDLFLKASRIVDDLPPPPEKGTLDLSKVLESQYFFA